MSGPTSAIVIVAVFSFLFFVMAGAKRPAKRDPSTGHLVLEYHPAIRILAFVTGAGMSVLIVVLVFVMPFKNPEDPYVAGALFLFFVLLGGSLYLESMVRVELCDDEISAWSPWRGSRSLRWDDIAEVTFSPSAQWFTVVSRSGVKIRVHTMMRGIREFCQTVRQRVDAGKLRRAETGFKIVSR